jgi:hypothetical protein
MHSSSARNAMLERTKAARRIAPKLSMESEHSSAAAEAYDRLRMSIDSVSVLGQDVA